MRAFCLPILATLGLGPGLIEAASAAPVIPDCAGKVQIAQAAMVQVGRDGTLLLERGRAVVLEGIRLPLDDGGGRLLEQQVLVALYQLTRKVPLTAAATPPHSDRYGRLRAQLFADAWLQRALLERGLARVMIAPDRSDCAPDLYEAEAVARKARRGLWALPAFKVRAAGMALKADTGSFEIVEGRVVNVGAGDGRTYLDFNADWRHGFSAVVAGEDRKVFRRAGFDLTALAGKRIRLRGLVEDHDGRPQIALSNPAQIEVLD